MQKIKRNLYLDIGFEEKSTICNERHSFIFSGISGISKRKKVGIITLISDCLRRPQFVKLYNFLCSLEYLGGLKIKSKEKVR